MEYLKGSNPGMQLTLVIEQIELVTGCGLDHCLSGVVSLNVKRLGSAPTDGGRFPSRKLGLTRNVARDLDTGFCQDSEVVKT